MDFTQASSSEIHIDSAWLTQQGAGPYILSSSDTTYILDTDVTVNGTAFVFGGKDITLDLNGHTVTYGNAARLQLPIAVSRRATSATPRWPAGT